MKGLMTAEAQARTEASCQGHKIFFLLLKGLANDLAYFYPSVMEQHNLKIVNNYLNTNIYSYLETSGGQSSNLYLNVVHFFNTSVN
jgi:hypothetical protein